MRLSKHRNKATYTASTKGALNSFAVDDQLLNYR